MRYTFENLVEMADYFDKCAAEQMGEANKARSFPVKSMYQHGATQYRNAAYIVRNAEFRKARTPAPATEATATEAITNAQA